MINKKNYEDDELKRQNTTMILIQFSVQKNNFYNYFHMFYKC